MSEWFWVAGAVNVGDLTTRPQFASALRPDSEWQRGPAFLYTPEAKWDVKPCPVVSDTQLSPVEKPYSVAARTSGRRVEDFATPILKRWPWVPLLDACQLCGIGHSVEEPLRLSLLSCVSQLSIC